MSLERCIKGCQRWEGSFRKVRLSKEETQKTYLIKEGIMSVLALKCVFMNQEFVNGLRMKRRDEQGLALPAQFWLFWLLELRAYY